MNINVKPELYLSLLASCDIVSILPGFGVGSSRAIGEALALKRRILTIDAITNPFAYGPIGIFVDREPTPLTEEGKTFFVPNIKHFVKTLEHINKRYDEFAGVYLEGRKYIEKTMSSSFLVKKRLAPAIKILHKTFDPSTNEYDDKEIKEMFKESYAEMHDRRFNPKHLL